ncbi:chord-domain-containing protein [Cytidiella melzeri]|nr:chord-domain-containing protein [Cytidiella melzeri]
MPRCTRRACGKDYDEASNTSDSCIFHSGVPAIEHQVFHEGLKSWSCCKDVNKPVLDFDEFMKIPGCMQGSHTDVPLKQEPPKSSGPSQLATAKTDTESGVETYSSATAPAPASSPAPAVLPPPPPPEEEDDPSVSVSVGTLCRRKGCGKSFVSDEVSRRGDSPEGECVYHPKPPIFHEGSKGYLCCKRRVLEFEEFLKIEGCKKGRHVFAPKNQPERQFTECRIDHYQTPTEVHVSVFARKADQDRSTVKISANEVSLDLYLPDSKRFLKSLELYGPIHPEGSSYKFYGTKLELILKKQDTRSWAVLEKTEYAVPESLTFGVGGRTGTIGSKQVILDNQNSLKIV